MSLISDALKKAQRARSPDVPGGTNSGFRRSSGVPVRLVVMISVGAAVFVTVAAVVTISILRRGDGVALAAAKSAPAPAASNTATTTTPAPSTAAPTVPAPQAKGPAVAESALVASVPDSAPASRAALPAAEPPSTSRRAPPMSAAIPPVAAKAEIRIETFLDDLKIVAVNVRPAAQDSKVMLGIGAKEPLVYRVNDIIDRNLNIRLTGIDADHLTFVDENGVIYTRRN